jgi:hypothetical protein
MFSPGMNWANYGAWHLDHIVPISSFDLTDREHFVRACHYTNYQPLWSTDNLKKGTKAQAAQVKAGMVAPGGPGGPSQQQPQGPQ